MRGPEERRRVCYRLVSRCVGTERNTPGGGVPLEFSKDARELRLRLRLLLLLRLRLLLLPQLLPLLLLRLLPRLLLRLRLSWELERELHVGLPLMRCLSRFLLI